MYIKTFFKKSYYGSILEGAQIDYQFLVCTLLSDVGQFPEKSTKILHLFEVEYVHVGRAFEQTKSLHRHISCSNKTISFKSTFNIFTITLRIRCRHIIKFFIHEHSIISHAIVNTLYTRLKLSLDTENGKFSSPLFSSFTS